MIKDKAHIDLWKSLICEKFGWSSDKVRQREFEYLNNEIFKHCGVDLSTATLRRIWTNQYKNTPQTQTLNALAHFLDYENWNDFKLKHPIHSSLEPESKSGFLRNRSLVIIPTLLILILIVSLVFTSSSKKDDSDPFNVTFMTDKHVYEGVPATAGFHYDISEVPQEVEIELSWNPYERVVLNPEANFYTGVYYYPDYHYAKLISNNQRLVFQPVHVISHDWHASFMRSAFEKTPIYLEEEEYFKGDRIEANVELLSKYEIGKSDTLFTEFVYSNTALDMISTDNLIFETRLRKIDYGSTFQCQNVLIYFKAENGFALIPLTESGCYGQLNIGVSEKWLSGKFSDLSSLETSLEEWEDIRIKIKDKAVSVQAGENIPLELTYQKELGRLKAVKFLFTGLGVVDQVRIFNDSGEPLFEDDLSRDLTTQ